MQVSERASDVSCPFTKDESRGETRRAANRVYRTVQQHLETFMPFDRITHDPAVMGGKPCIRGLRVTVGTVLGLLAAGQSRELILLAYPYLVRRDIDAALAYAAWRLEESEEALVVT